MKEYILDTLLAAMKIFCYLILVTTLEVDIVTTNKALVVIRLIRLDHRSVCLMSCFIISKFSRRTQRMRNPKKLQNAPLYHQSTGLAEEFHKLFLLPQRIVQRGILRIRAKVD
jgi:hypothetical protein